MVVAPGLMFAAGGIDVLGEEQATSAIEASAQPIFAFIGHPPH